MITPARKSFALSLAFHALMGSMAFWVLTQMNHPIPVTRIPFKIMSFQPTEHPLTVQLPQPIAPTQQQPLTKSTPTPIQQAKPIPKTSITPAPMPIPVATPITPALQAATPAPVVTAITSPVQAVSVAPIAAPKAEPKPDTASEKRHFLASLRSSIQNNLRYPPAARRRGMEGEVAVRFTLNDNGSISSINILNGENIFHNAVKAAISTASGIDIPKNIADSFPMEINLILNFELKNG
ncbi:MAG: TonB family protein [Sulfuricurvum sp.]|nr:TonB family protein [Sulfuricurvum sp.]